MTWRLDRVDCPLCGGSRSSKLGIRGNREHFGADPTALPHIVTDVVRCQGCDFIYTNPMIRGMEHLETAFYDDPQCYSATTGNEASAMYRSRLALLERFQAPGTLLDVGSGKGEFLAECAARGWKALGVEPSARFCEYARETYGVDARLGILDASSPPAESGLDAVTLNHVLEHVDDPCRLLSTVRERLKPRGVVFVEVPNTDSYLLRLADLYFRLKGLAWSSRLSPLHAPFHRFGFTARSLTYALNKAGYEVLALQTYSGSDRGCRDAVRSPAVRLRDLASGALALLGNRELLAVVARPAQIRPT